MMAAMKRWEAGDFSRDPNTAITEDTNQPPDHPAQAAARTGTGQNGQEAKEPPTSSDGTQANVCVASLSTRGSGTGSDAPDPVATFAESGIWPPAGKANQFLHLPPELHDQFQERLGDEYGDRLDYIDLTPANTAIGSTATDPPKSAGTMARFKQQAVIAAGSRGTASSQVSRIMKYGMNAYENNAVP